MRYLILFSLAEALLSAPIAGLTAPLPNHPPHPPYLTGAEVSLTLDPANGASVARAPFTRPGNAFPTGQSEILLGDIAARNRNEPPQPGGDDFSSCPLAEDLKGDVSNPYDPMWDESSAVSSATTEIRPPGVADVEYRRRQDDGHYTPKDGWREYSRTKLELMRGTWGDLDAFCAFTYQADWVWDKNMQGKQGSQPLSWFDTQPVAGTVATVMCKNTLGAFVGWVAANPVSVPGGYITTYFTDILSYFVYVASKYNDPPPTTVDVTVRDPSMPGYVMARGIQFSYACQSPSMNVYISPKADCVASAGAVKFAQPGCRPGYHDIGTQLCQQGPPGSKKYIIEAHNVEEGKATKQCPYEITPGDLNLTILKPDKSELLPPTQVGLDPNKQVFIPRGLQFGQYTIELQSTDDAVNVMIYSEAFRTTVIVPVDETPLWSLDI